MTASAWATAPRRHAQLLRYSLWQFRDYATSMALLSIILFGLLGALEVMQLHVATSAARGDPSAMARLPVMQVQAFQHLFSIYAAVAPVLALSGIVSQDRSLGYVRLLFAKPLDPIAFYLQSFIVRAVGFFVVAGVLIATYLQFEPVAYLPRVAAALGLFYLAFGGMVFLASVLTKYDGLGTIAFLLVSVIVWEKWEASKGLFRFLIYLCPPIGEFSALGDWVANVNALHPDLPAAFPTKWVIWTVCYGVACLLLGLVLLRKRPVARA